MSGCQRRASCSSTSSPISATRSTAGAAYLHNFIDAGNQTPMWGAWAVEPFASRGDVAVKVEDLVWFGREQCQIV